MTLVWAMRSEVINMVTLVAMLSVIGWSFGYAAALGHRSIRSAIGGAARRPVWMAGAAMAIVIAAGSLYGYLVVLSTMGMVQYCDPIATTMC